MITNFRLDHLEKVKYKIKIQKEFLFVNYILETLIWFYDTHGFRALLNNFDMEAPSWLEELTHSGRIPRIIMRIMRINDEENKVSVRYSVLDNICQNRVSLQHNAQRMTWWSQNIWIFFIRIQLRKIYLKFLAAWQSQLVQGKTKLRCCSSGLIFLLEIIVEFDVLF